jgi:hypothetical protein
VACGLSLGSGSRGSHPPRRSLGDRRRRRGLPARRRRPHGHPCRELMRKLLGQPRPLDRNAGEFLIPNRTHCQAFLSTGWCRGTGKTTAASSKRPYRCRVNGTCRWSPLTQPPAPGSPRLLPADAGDARRSPGTASPAVPAPRPGPCTQPRTGRSRGHPADPTPPPGRVKGAPHAPRPCGTAGGGP